MKKAWIPLLVLVTASCLAEAPDPDFGTDVEALDGLDGPPGCGTPACGFHCGQSPLMIDIHGDNYSLTTVANGVFFDIENNGIKRQVSWTTANSDDGFLVYDRNGNGLIDNGGEMFGSATAQVGAPTTGHDTVAHNGFNALKNYDDNHDGVINNLDIIWTKLRIWTDDNHDGISQPGEFWYLSEGGWGDDGQWFVPPVGSRIAHISSISLNYSNSIHWTDSIGNQYWYSSLLGHQANSPWNTNGYIWDIYLATAPTGTTPNSVGVSVVLVDYADAFTPVLSSAANGVMFDMVGLGTKERWSWPANNFQSPGFLVYDRNGNGLVDSAVDLFTNQTIQSLNNPVVPNGFNSLLFLDENKDGKLDASDSTFTSLRLWIDSNHDGISQPAELWTMAVAGIRQINLNYDKLVQLDQYGNQIRYMSTFVRTNGQTSRMWDVVLTKNMAGSPPPALAPLLPPPICAVPPANDNSPPPPRFWYGIRYDCYVIPGGMDDITTARYCKAPFGTFPPNLNPVPIPAIDMSPQFVQANPAKPAWGTPVIRVYSGTIADFAIDKFINYMHEDVKNACISKYIYVGNKCFPSDGHGHGISFPGQPVYNATLAVYQRDGTEDYVINSLTAYQWQPGSPF